MDPTKPARAPSTAPEALRDSSVRTDERWGDISGEIGRSEIGRGDIGRSEIARVEPGRIETRGDAGRGEVLDLPVLTLNRHYVPIRVTSVRRGLVLLYTGHAQALDVNGELFDFEHWSKLAPGSGDDLVTLVNGQLRAPRVLHLSRYDRVPQLAIRLTRQNLMLRDQYQCQYCGKRPGPAELNLDHVMPRSRGGADSWDNLVVSCRPCNVKKGKKTPREAGMHLLRNPATPKLSHAAMLLQGLVPPFVEWQPFLATG